MTNILDWITQLGFDIPGMAFIKYILAGVILLVIIDAFLNLIFAGLHTLFTGGRR